jgi:hypothetical protein
MTYYTDVAGNTCGFDLPEYPLVYFTSTNDPVTDNLFSRKDFVYLHVQKQGILYFSVIPLSTLPVLRIITNNSK